MNKIYYHYQGNTVRASSMNPNTAKEVLEPAVYSLECCPMTGFYLQIMHQTFELPEKLYGDAEAVATRVYERFKISDTNLGAMFIGDKGSGKTMSVMNICNKALADGIPVVMVQSNHRGSAFNDFIKQLGTIVLVFDEFGKTYDQEDQDALLGLFDGAIGGRRLHIVTENNDWRINDFMRQRPGRFLYSFPYSKLSSEVIQQYCADYDIQQNFIDQIITLQATARTFSFDILQAIVQEILIYKDTDMTFVEITKAMNIHETMFMKSANFILQSIKDSKGNEIKPDSIGQSFHVHDCKDFSIRIPVEGLLVEDDGDEMYSVHLNEYRIVQQVDNLVVMQCESSKAILTFIAEESKPINYLAV